MIPLPSEEATPPVTKIYFVSATIVENLNMIYLFNILFIECATIYDIVLQGAKVHKITDMNKRYAKIICFRCLNCRLWFCISEINTNFAGENKR